MGSKVSVSNNVDHPEHYNFGQIETIDYIMDKELGFCLGNAVKYISRAGHKSGQEESQDLAKAVWYILRHMYEQSKKGQERSDDCMEQFETIKGYIEELQSKIFKNAIG